MYFVTWCQYINDATKLLLFQKCEVVVFVEIFADQISRPTCKCTSQAGYVQCSKVCEA